MITTNIWKGTVKGCLACLIFLCLWVMVPGAWAAHEVSQSDIKANVLTNTITKWTDDLTVEWKLPSMGSDILNGYLYKWNDSASSLNITDTPYTSFTAGVDGTVGPEVNPPNVVKAKADLANLDSGNVLYLHIMTFYLASGVPTVSSDVVYGPFLIDNVAPVGTVRIVDVNGTDVTSTSDTIVYLQLSAAKDPVTMYLSETSTKPATGVAFSTNPVWSLIDTTPGNKTIYAWFEDSVLNISQPATDSFTLLSGTNISPNTATLDLAAGATQVFRVEGTDATYNWSIVEEVPETSGTVAQITVGGSATNSVTVQGLVTGAFKLRAVPTGAGDTLTSGVISVVRTSTTKQYSLLTGLNIISLSRTGTGWTKAANLATAVGNSSTSVIKWDAARQGFVAHIKGTPLNNFDLVEGDAYFVNVNAPSTFDVTGQTVVRTFSLVTGLNLIGLPDAKASLTKAANLAADVGTSCISITKWDASRQGFVAHIKGTPLNNYDVSVGDGYFVNVNADSQW